MNLSEHWKPVQEWTRQTRHSLVRDRLREAILRGYFKPGERLDQKEIARLFNVSRSPVRAALVSLAAEGLVENEPHRGSIVAELTPVEVEEIYLIRKVLEGIASRLGVPNLTQGEIEQLQALMDELETATDVDERVRLNQEFHNVLYQAAGRPRLYALIQTLSNTALPYTRQYFITEEHWAIASSGHRDIFAACLDRDGDGAQAATEKHIAEVCESMLSHWGQKPTEDGNNP